MKKPLCCLESNLVGEDLLSIPKLVFVNEKNTERGVLLKAKKHK